MSHMKKLIYFLVLAGTLTLSGCALNKMIQAAADQSIEVKPNPLELHGDKVEFTVEVSLPTKMLRDGIVYSLNPTYVYGDKEIALKAIEFKKEDHPESDTQRPSLSEKYTLDYEGDMNPGDLMVTGTATITKNGKSKSIDAVKVAEGVVTTSQFVKDAYFAAYADHGYNNKEELMPTKVNFFFEQGRSVLRTSELRSQRGKDFNAFIAEKNVTKTVTITGTHSPEGPERINSNLSKDRAEAIEKYYRNQMRRYDYKGAADSIKFIIKPVVEDWTEFKNKLKDYKGISDAQKEEYTRIINGGGSFEDKEKRLQQLSTYKKVFNDIYPELRAAKTEVLTVKHKKSDAEISVLAKQIAKDEVSADTLSLQELMYAATLTPSLEEKKDIFTAATKKDETWVSHNNLGAVYLELAINAEGADRNALLEKAATQLELSNKKKENAEALSNMSTVYLLQGNHEKAKEAADKASGMTLSSENERGLNGVKGSIELASGDYAAAQLSLAGALETTDNLFNRGLAQLLKGDAQNASNTFSEVVEKDPKYGDAYYLKAVANARLKKEAEVFSSLKEAVKVNPDYAERALNDLEFSNYAANEAFRAALR